MRGIMHAAVHEMMCCKRRTSRMLSLCLTFCSCSQRGTRILAMFLNTAATVLSYHLKSPRWDDI